jgi:cytochrome b
MPTHASSLGSSARPIFVWDLGVRLFHGLLLITVAVAAWTGFFGAANLLTPHLIAGVVAGILVVWRVIWGVLGSTYARFGAFLPYPRAVLGRLSELRNRNYRRYLSHNPLGALMVFAVLSLIFLLAISGAVSFGGELKQGPLASTTTYAIGADAHRIHELLAYGLIGLIVLHLLGVAFETAISRERLILAMFDGYKSADGAEQLARKGARPFLAFFLLVLIAGSAGVAGVLFSMAPALGVPPASLDPTYAKECGECHFPYPPSLANARTWTTILDTLDHHFGEDASVSDETKRFLSTYLVNQSSEHFDTRPAHVFSQTDPANPLRITATPFWRRHHRDIPDAVFASKAVATKGACNACHRDALTGRFDPQAITIPEQALR